MFAPAHLTLTLFAVASFTGNALGAPLGFSEDDTARLRAAVARGQLLPLAHILSIAQRHVPGEVLKVELEEAARQLVYEVKVLTRNGRVRDLQIDAHAGRVLKIEND